MYNTCLTRERKQIAENSNLWAGTFTPFLEFDFIGDDTWTSIFEFTAEQLTELSTGEKLELRNNPYSTDTHVTD